jgi:hypothetical protein
MELDDAFQGFFDAIALGQLEGRVQSAWSRLHDYLVTAYDIAPDAVRLQGSYANDTTVKPAFPTDEYDVDVIATCAQATDEPNEALEYLQARLADNGDYRQRIERKTPCVRLRYASDTAGRFHLDVVPARRGVTAPLEIPQRDQGWKDNDPDGFRLWCLSQGGQFARTVRMLKRWRDINQGQRRGVKSVVLQVLVARSLPLVTRDAISVARTLRGIATLVEPHEESPPPLPHPVLTSEDLSANWPSRHYKVFRRQVTEAAALAESALSDPGAASSHERWRTLFGSDFPPYSGPPPEPPGPPPPGYHTLPQSPPRGERYG